MTVLIRRKSQKGFRKALAGAAVIGLIFAVVGFDTRSEVLAATPEVTWAMSENRLPQKPKCEAKLLWYTSGSDVCAYSTDGKKFTWQKSIEKADTTKMMSTCRSFFLTA